MARKDWIYAPLPLGQAKALDEILKTKECENYGIVDRIELIRLIIGEFLIQYEYRDKRLIETLKEAFSNSNPPIENHTNKK